MAARAEGAVAAAPARRAAPRRAPKRKAAAPATLSPPRGDEDVAEIVAFEEIDAEPSAGVVTRRAALLSASGRRTRARTAPSPSSAPLSPPLRRSARLLSPAPPAGAAGASARKGLRGADGKTPRRVATAVSAALDLSPLPPGDGAEEGAEPDAAAPPPPGVAPRQPPAPLARDAPPSSSAPPERGALPSASGVPRPASAAARRPPAGRSRGAACLRFLAAEGAAGPSAASTGDLAAEDVSRKENEDANRPPSPPGKAPAAAARLRSPSPAPAPLSPPAPSGSAPHPASPSTPPGSARVLPTPFGRRRSLLDGLVEDHGLGEARGNGRKEPAAADEGARGGAPDGSRGPASAAAGAGAVPPPLPSVGSSPSAPPLPASVGSSPSAPPLPASVGSSPSAPPLLASVGSSPSAPPLLASVGSSPSAPPLPPSVGSSPGPLAPSSAPEAPSLASPPPSKRARRDPWAAQRLPAQLALLEDMLQALQMAHDALRRRGRPASFEALKDAVEHACARRFDHARLAQLVAAAPRGAIRLEWRRGVGLLAGARGAGRGAVGRRDRWAGEGGDAGAPKLYVELATTWEEEEEGDEGAGAREGRRCAPGEASGRAAGSARADLGSCPTSAATPAARARANAEVRRRVHASLARHLLGSYARAMREAAAEARAAGELARACELEGAAESAVPPLATFLAPWPQAAPEAPAADLTGGSGAQERSEGDAEGGRPEAEGRDRGGGSRPSATEASALGAASTADARALGAALPRRLSFGEGDAAGSSEGSVALAPPLAPPASSSGGAASAAASLPPPPPSAAKPPRPAPSATAVPATPLRGASALATPLRTPSVTRSAAQPSYLWTPSGPRFLSPRPPAHPSARASPFPAPAARAPPGRAPVGFEIDEEDFSFTGRILDDPAEFDRELERSARKELGRGPRSEAGADGARGAHGGREAPDGARTAAPPASVPAALRRLSLDGLVSASSLRRLSASEAEHRRLSSAEAVARRERTATLEALPALLQRLRRIFGASGPRARKLDDVVASLSATARADASERAGLVARLRTLADAAPEVVSLKPYGMCGTPAVWIDRKADVQAAAERLRKIAQRRFDDE